jgi:hypothetical protein
MLPSIKDLLGDNNIKEMLLPPYVRAVIQLVFLYNMRISELLSVTNLDVIEPDRVICLGKKRSYCYIIFVPGLSSLLHSSAIKNLTFMLFPYSYLKIYKWCRKLGICKLIGNRTHKTLLHLGRFRTACQLNDIYKQYVPSEVLRHKSKKSILNYLK